MDSAAEVAQELAKHGARGILLTSSPDKLIGRDDIRNALTDLKRRIRAERPSHPVLVFYYMGHALGDEYSSSLYLAPGNMVLDNQFGASQTSTIRLLKTFVWNEDVLGSMFMFNLSPQQAYWDNVFMTDMMPGTNLPENVKAAEVWAKLEAFDWLNRHVGLPAGQKQLIPYVVLFDNCYDAVEQDLTTARLTTGVDPLQAFKTYEAGKIQSMLPEIENGGLVMYAAHPGSWVGDAFYDPNDHPDENRYPKHVGALARRLILVLEAGREGIPLTIGAFRRSMLRDSLDHGDADAPATHVPYTVSATTDEVANSIFFSRLNAPIAVSNVEKREGTASNTSICCGRYPGATSPAPFLSQRPSLQNFLRTLKRPQVN